MLEKAFSKLVAAHGAKIISYDRWGKYRLAYAVRGNEYGIYTLARFESEKSVEELLKEIDAFFKIKHNDLVMRHVTSVLDIKAPLAYQRPDSVEDIAEKAKLGPDTRSSGRPYERREDRRHASSLTFTRQDAAKDESFAENIEEADQTFDVSEE